MKEEIFLNILGLIVLVGVFFLVVLFFSISKLGCQYDRECAKLDYMHRLNEKEIEKNKK